MITTIIIALFAAGILSCAIGRLWKKDSKLMEFVLFRHESRDALNRCLPIWREVGKHVSGNVLIKFTACRVTCA